MSAKLPRVVNRHHYKKSGLPTNAIYVGRGTPLGNPYRVDEYGIAAMGLYRRWLYQQIRCSNPSVLDAMRKISHDSLLVCSCAPKPCHADVIVRAWRWLQSEGRL